MNNRQNGRRRGRGGQQARNGQPGAPDRGNRLDNRARGNAAQLLEKYKTLARDAQMQGDRVNTEYYLQFADHYFRVLSENRSRFEEQQQRRGRDDFGFEGGFENEGEPQRGYGQAEPMSDEAWDDGEEVRAAPPRPEPQRPPREFQPRRERAFEGEGNGARPEANGARAEEAAPVEGRRERGRRNGGASNGNGHAAQLPLPEADEAAPARIAIDLPPAFAPAPAEASAPVAEDGSEPAPKRRRTRRPKAETETAQV